MIPRLVYPNCFASRRRKYQYDNHEISLEALPYVSLGRHLYSGHPAPDGGRVIRRRTASYATIVLILLLFVLVRFGRVALLPLGILARTLLRYSAGTLLRRNVFAHILH